MRPVHVIRSAASWVCAIPITGLAALLTTVAGHIVPGSLAAHHVARTWARLVLKLMGIRLTIEGIPPGESSGPPVVVANHTSRLDILVLLAALPPALRPGFLAKHTLFDVPLLGRAMRTLGCVPVNREDRRSAPAMFTESLRLLRTGHAMVVFPEETWSADDQLLPLQRGGFLLARRAQAPLVPVGIDGTFEAMPGARIGVTPGHVVVRFGTAIDAAGGLSIETLRIDVRTRLERLRHPPVDE